MNDRRLLIVGAGRWHLPLYERARALGIHVVATDIHADAPGFALADRTAVIDVRDVERTYSLARDHGVQGVLTGVDLAIPTVAAVAERLGLRGLALRAAAWTTDKALMRARAVELGLDVPRHCQVRDPSELEEAVALVRMPCVVKPVDNCGSRGVRVVVDAEDLRPALERALGQSFSGRALVEEFMVGDECSVEGLVDDAGDLHILGISRKRKSPLPCRFDLELHYPGDFGPEVVARIEAYARSLNRGLGVAFGLTHTELMVSGERVRLIETAARGCGAFVSGKLMPATTGVDVTGTVIRQALREAVEVPAFERRHGLLRFIVAPPGRVRRVSGVEEARAVPGILDLGLDLCPGDRVPPALDTTGRNGYVLAVGASRKEVDLVADRALALVRIEMEEAA